MIHDQDSRERRNVPSVTGFSRIDGLPIRERFPLQEKYLVGSRKERPLLFTLTGQPSTVMMR